MATRTPMSASLLELAMELAGVGAMMLIAGASDDAGTMMIIIMMGFWLIFLISQSGVVKNMVSALSAMALNPTNTPGNNTGSNGIFF